MFKFDLGDKVKDAVTGFEGVVIARSEYLNGCIRYGVQSPKLKDNKPQDCEWIDQGQLSLVKSKAVNLEVKRTGGPRPSPRMSANPQ